MSLEAAHGRTGGLYKGPATQQGSFEEKPSDTQARFSLKSRRKVLFGKKGCHLPSELHHQHGHAMEAAAGVAQLLPAGLFQGQVCLPGQQHLDDVNHLPTEERRSESPRHHLYSEGEKKPFV